MTINETLCQINDKLKVENFIEAFDFNVFNFKKIDFENSNFMFSKKTLLRQSNWKIKIMTQNKMKMKNIFSTIHVAFKSTLSEFRYNNNRNRYQWKMSITILSIWWLVKLSIFYVFRISFFNSTINEWKYQLNLCWLMPSNALIFEFCHDNNFADVQILLSRDKASVKNINFRKQTSLHVNQSLILTFQISILVAFISSHIHEFNFNI